MRTTNSVFRRTLLLVTSGVCLISAITIVWTAGLPDRATVNAIALSGADDQPVAPEIGASAPPFKLSTTSGAAISLSDLHGTPIMLNFWATW